MATTENTGDLTQTGDNEETLQDWLDEFETKTSTVTTESLDETLSTTSFDTAVSLSETASSTTLQGVAPPPAGP